MKKYVESVATIFLNEDKTKILVFDHIKLDKISLPIGKVEVGDSINKTFIKEMKEELDITIIDYDVLGSLDVVLDIEEVISDNHIVFALCDKYNGVMTNNEPNKHRAMEWLEISEIDLTDTDILSVNLIEGIKLLRTLNIVEK